MGYVTILYLIVVGLLLIASLFLRPDNAGTSNADDQPTTLTRRGSFIPYLIGTHEAEPGFGWADDANRFTIEESISSGGKGKGGGGGGGDIAQSIWYSAGWHILCVGPRTALLAIIENGKQVWPPEGQPGIYRNTTPSGTSINAGQVGTFRIYWGDLDQPIDPYLAANMGVASRWPGVCHIVWQFKRLSTSQAWSTLKYKTSGDLQCVESIGDKYILDNGTGARGVNGVHCVLQILTGRFPYGLGFKREEVDRFTSENASTIAIDEHMAFNLRITDGDTADKILQGLLGDLGMMLVDTNGKFVLQPLRTAESAVPIFDDDIIMPPDLEINVSTDESRINRVVYTFKDEDAAYRDNDIAFTNAAVGDDLRRYKENTISLFSPTDIQVATTIANRRVAEPFGDNGNIKVKALRSARLLLPGDAFQIPLIGPVRVLSVLADTFSASTSIDCALDSYAVPPDLNIIDRGNRDAGNSSGTALPPTPDLAVQFLEVPENAAAGQLKITVLRIRGNRSIVGANIYASADEASYVLLGRQSGGGTGGVLLDSLSVTDDDTIENGPTIQALGPDMTTVRDLTSDGHGWRSGSQIMVINDEVFFLRNVTAVAEVDWQPNHLYTAGDSVIPIDDVTGFRYVCVDPGVSGGSEPVWPRDVEDRVVDNGSIWEARGFRYATHGLIRARYSSAKGEHGAGDVALIANPTSITALASTIFAPGIVLCVKTQPYTPGAATSISAADPVCELLTGEGTGKDYWVTDENEYVIDATSNRLYFRS